MPNDAVVQVVCGKPGHLRSERAVHYPTRDDAVGAVLIPPLHPLQMRTNNVLLAHALLRFQDLTLSCSLS